MGKALDAEERLHVCFTINASIISVKHFTCDLFHFRYLFKMRCNSLKCVIIFVVRKQVLCHYFNELSFFVVYKDNLIKKDISCRIADATRLYPRPKGRGFTFDLIKKEISLGITHSNFGYATLLM
jgi:hypothetical protein